MYKMCEAFPVDCMASVFATKDDSQDLFSQWEEYIHMQHLPYKVHCS